MKRREFLGTAAAGAMAVGSTSCMGLGGSQVVGARFNEREIDEVLARLNLGLTTLAKSPQVLLPSASHQSTGFVSPKRGDALTRKSLRSLLVASAVQELSPENRHHPKVQDAVLEFAPEMDEAVAGTCGLLDGLEPAHHGQLQNAFREDPELGSRIAETIERPARGLGVPMTTRLKTRYMIKHIAGRMRMQDPALAFDEYREKVTRVATRSADAEAFRRKLATRLSHRAFWTHERRLARATGGTTRPRESDEEAGDVMVSVGGIMAGGGLAVLGISALFAAAEPAFVIVMTVGAVLILAGLITMVVGAIIS